MLFLILFFLLLFASGVSLIALIVMAIRKKKLKVISVLTGSLFGGAILSLVIIFMLVSAMDLEKGEAVSLTNESQKTEASSEDDDETDIDLSEYQEADRDKINNNEYEKQESLKLTNVEVVSIIPGEDHPGNDVVIKVDNGDGLVLTDPVGREEIEEGGTYTFYGTPNEDRGLIIIDVE